MQKLVLVSLSFALIADGFAMNGRPIKQVAKLDKDDHMSLLDIGRYDDPALFSEGGYRSVASLKSNIRMRAFMQGVIERHGLHVLDEDQFSSIVPYYSGMIKQQTFEHLLKELESASWLVRGEEQNAGSAAATTFASLPTALAPPISALASAPATASLPAIPELARGEPRLLRVDSRSAGVPTEQEKLASSTAVEAGQPGSLVAQSSSAAPHPSNSVMTPQVVAPSSSGPVDAQQLEYRRLPDGNLAALIPLPQASDISGPPPLSTISLVGGQQQKPSALETPADAKPEVHDDQDISRDVEIPTAMGQAADAAPNRNVQYVRKQDGTFAALVPLLEPTVAKTN